MGLLGKARGLLNKCIPTEVGVYSQGANSKSMTARIATRDRTVIGYGDLHQEVKTVHVAQEDFSGGFSTSSPVSPSRGDTWTDADSRVFVVDAVRSLGIDQEWALDLRRSIARGDT